MKEEVRALSRRIDSLEREKTAMAEALGLTAEQVERVYDDIDAKRKAAAYSHAAPLLVE